MQKYILFILIINSLLLSACSTGDDENTDKEANARATLVTVASVKSQAIEIRQSSIGSLEGLINPTLAAEMAARVIKVHVSTGQHVEKGQLIATLDASDYNHAA